MLSKKMKVFSALLFVILIAGIYGCKLPGEDNNPAGTNTNGGYTGGGYTGGNTGGYTGGGNTGTFTININGDWQGTFQETWTNDPNHPMLISSGTLKITFYQSNNNVTATCQWEAPGVIDRGVLNSGNGMINGNNFTWSNSGVVNDSNGSWPITDNGNGAVNGNTISGTFETIITRNGVAYSRKGTFSVTKLGTTGSGTNVNFTIYTDPNVFKSAAASLGISTVIDFEDAASASGSTTSGAPVFNGGYYAGKGVTFSNPQGYPFYIAPGGLFWNINKSLSVGNFPFDPSQMYSQHDNLVITFSQDVRAAGLDVIDSGKPIVEFKDSNGNKISTANLSGEYMPYRAFIGIISNGPLIKEINIIDEPPNDGDDVNYDNIIFYK